MKIKAKEKNIRKKNYMEGKTLQSTNESITKQATKHNDGFIPAKTLR